MSKLIRIASLFLLLNLSYAAPIKITFWHSMGGRLGVTVNQVVNKFNNSQSKYKVIPIYKGSYPETLMSTVAAFRAGQQPDIVQIFEVGTAMMTNPPGVVIPVYKLMQQAKIPFNTNNFLPTIASYYSNSQGQLLAMPFNSSTPVMFYNKRAFKKAGLNPVHPPKTWGQLKLDSEKLLKAGYPCGFTTGWPSWIQLEAFSAWQNIPFATEENGIAGVDPKLIYNNSTVVRHIANLAKWQKKKIFVYGGRQDNAMTLFTSDQCPILMESSGSLSMLKGNVNFPMGVADIPYEANVKGAPQNMLIGGAALWAMAGHSKKVEEGVAKFFAFLTKPKVQAFWQQQTGYLPVTKAAFALSKKQGFYKRNPGAIVAINQLMYKSPTVNSRGIRLGAYPQIRMINAQELEAVFSGQLTAKQALDKAVHRGNAVLHQFALNVRP